MTRVEPKVFLISETRFAHEDRLGAREWMDHLGGSAVFGHLDGSDAEQVVELMARRCYKSFDVGLNANITKIRTDSRDYHANIQNSAHGSVLHHGTVTFACEDVSRVFTHEMVRNSIGNGFSQESLRYVRLTEGIRFWIPPIIAENAEALAVFEKAIEQDEENQRELARIFDIENIKEFARKKELTSAFRRVAPDGLATGIGITFNMRSLRWAIEQRTSGPAEHEIRLVFNLIAEIARERWPFIFQDFTTDGADVMEWVPRNHKI